MFFTGGEPFMEPEIISYIVDEIIRRKINIRSFSCITNGSIRDKSIADSWNRLADYIADRYTPTDNPEADRKYLRAIGRITVSDDPYHQLEEDPLETVKWYRQYLNNHCIITKEVNRPDTVQRVHILGRAAEQEDLKKSDGAYYPVCPYRIEMDADGFVETSICVGWDGKIMIGEDCSYEQQDKRNLGNIFSSHLSDLVDEGYSEPFSRGEAIRYNDFYTALKTGRYEDEDQKDFLETALRYFDAVYSARKTYKELCPFLTRKDVAELAYADLVLYFSEPDTEDGQVFLIDTLEPYTKTVDECRKMKYELIAKALIFSPSSIPKMMQAAQSKVPVENIPVKAWD